MYFLNLIFSCEFILTVETDDNDYRDNRLECFMDHECVQRKIHVDAIYGKPIELNDSETNEKQSENKNSTIEPVKIKNEDVESSNHFMEYDDHTIETVHRDIHDVFESLPELEDACEMYEIFYDGNAFTHENSKNNAPTKCKKHTQNDKKDETELTDACNPDSKINCTITNTTNKVNDKQNDECVKDDSSGNKENTKALDINNDKMMEVQTNLIVKQNNNKNEHIKANSTPCSNSINTSTISKTIEDNPLLDHKDHFSSCGANEHSSANKIQDQNEIKVPTESLIGSAIDKTLQQMKIEREGKPKYSYNNRMQPNSMLKITYSKSDFVDNNQKNKAHGKRSSNKSRITKKAINNRKGNNPLQATSKKKLRKIK